MKKWYLETAKKQKILVDKDVWDKYKNHSWYLGARHNGDTGYAQTKIAGKHVYLHRLIMGTPLGKHTDHINGDKLDNRRKNLRVVSPSKNALSHNTYPNKNGYRGITFHHKTKKWIAQITVKYVHKYLGLFRTRELAHQAYLEAKKFIN